MVLEEFQERGSNNPIYPEAIKIFSSPFGINKTGLLKNCKSNYVTFSATTT
jgi:hypothetical protein